MTAPARRAGLLALALGLCLADPARAQYEVRLEGAAVATARNDVRIPGDAGTRFSLADELEPGTSWAWRLEAGRRLGDEDWLGITIAPFESVSRGRIGRDVAFAGTVFPAGTDLEGTFKFDSFRLTWRHRVLRRGSLEAWLGATAKIRDARVALAGEGLAAEKANTGFVPLVNFRAEWRPAPGVGLLLAGDALAAPQGRAEDVLAAVSVDLFDERSRLFVGYRILEGGADNDEVYTFSLLHYAVAGMEWRFGPLR